jgi:hypothetical protein
MALWQDLISSQIQAQKLISGPSPSATTRLLPFYRTKSGSVTSFHTLHNALRKTSVHNGADRQVWGRGGNLSHVLCECEALVTLRHTCLGCCFLDP